MAARGGSRNRLGPARPGRSGARGSAGAATGAAPTDAPGTRAGPATVDEPLPLTGSPSNGPASAVGAGAAPGTGALAGLVPGDRCRDSDGGLVQLSRELQDTLLETGNISARQRLSLDTGALARSPWPPAWGGGQPPARCGGLATGNVILVLSDCTDRPWQGGGSQRPVRWGRTAPVAILQPLPSDSGPEPSSHHGRAVVSVSKGAPNSGLAFLPFDDLASPPVGAVAVPSWKSDPPGSGVGLTSSPAPG